MGRHAPPSALAPRGRGELRGRSKPPTTRTCPTPTGSPDPTAGDQTPDTILFIPSTPRSQLANALKRVDRAFTKLHGGQPIRFVERTGPTIAQLLSSTDLWLDQPCGRPRCLPCGHQGGMWEPPAPHPPPPAPALPAT